MKTLVSILIPAYNAEKWVGAAIDSALNQTWTNIEIVVVNDGSTDNTLNIAKSYKSGLVNIINQENKGSSAARNQALRAAQGDYIQWLDADDLLARDKIELQLKGPEIIGNELVLLSSAWGTFQYRVAKARFVAGSLWRDRSPVEWITTKMTDNAWMAIESWLVSRKLTEIVGPWDERLSLDDDGEYFCRVVAKSKEVKFVPDAKTYVRRLNSSSISSAVNISDEKLQSQFLSICLQIQYLLSLEDSDRTRAACLKLLQNYLIYFYPEKKDILEKAAELARSLNGCLSPPMLNWKYNIIKKIFGWRVAKKTGYCFSYVKNIAKMN